MAQRDNSVEPAPSERKFFNKHKWKGKLFSHEDKTAKPQEYPEKPANDLLDFFHGPGTHSNASDQVASQEESEKGSPEPRRPSVSSADKVTSGDAQYQRRKPLRKKGLRVTFSSAPPDIIGEGGDESEIPAMDIAKSRATASSWRQSQGPSPRQHARRSSPPPQVELALPQEPSPASQDEDGTGPSSLRRHSKGFHNVQQASKQGPRSQALGVYETPMARRIEGQGSLSSPEAEGDPEAFAAIYSEYTKASPISPRVVVDEPPAQSSEDRPKHKGEIDDLRGYGSLKPFTPDFDLSPGNSVTPIPTPQPNNIRDPPLSSYNFPESAPTQQSGSQAKIADASSQQDTEADGHHVSRPKINPTMISPPLSSPPLSNPPLKAPAISLRTVAKNLGGDALNEFATRVQRFYGIFRLGASANRSLGEISFERWIYAGTWWFLKGRSELENAVRGRPRSRDRNLRHDESDTSAGLKQAYLNLAKASWITMEVTTKHSELRKYGSGTMNSLLAITESLGDSRLAGFIQVHLAITTSMRALAMSMKRNNKMPPPDFEAQGLDSRIWIETPRLTSRIASFLTGTSSEGLLEEGSASSGTVFPYPVGDTKCHFNYGSMFVDVTLQSSDDAQEEVHLTCIVSVLRQRSHRDLEVVLSSQDDQVNLTIQSQKRRGLTWKDVHWETESHRMKLNLSGSVELEIQFSEHNFRSLLGICDYSRKIRKSLEASEVEETVFKSTVKCVHYVDTPDAKTFPTEPVQRCDVRLFERSLTLVEGSGRRRCYNGHRLIIVTPPSSKNLSHISQSLGKEIPMLFSYVRGDNDGPAMLLKSDLAGSTLVITFNDSADRENFHAQLDGTSMKHEEMCNEIVPLQGMRICASKTDEGPPEPDNFLNSWRWQQLRVINRRPEYFENGIIKNVLSEHLRLCAQCEAGTFLDRINLGPGELQLRLSTDLPAQVTLLRPPQHDMTVTFASNMVSTSKAKALSDSVKRMGIQPTLRTYSFQTLPDLHRFQKQVTGFAVRYDGFATSFGISRRRMVVPIYKRLEASIARLQIVQLDKVIQFVGYFKDLHLGTCMNFVLKSTDNFESLTRSEQYCIRIVDAKFALPKKSTEPHQEFLCLDTPEYPGEHDDIMIGFDSEAERDRFGAALPAPMVQHSRLGSLGSLGSLRKGS